MLVTMAALWGAGLALYLTHHTMLRLGRLGACLLRPQHRSRPLDRRMALSQVRRSRERPQPRLVPLRLAPANPNGGSHSRSLRRQ